MKLSKQTLGRKMRNTDSRARRLAAPEAALGRKRVGLAAKFGKLAEKTAASYPEAMRLAVRADSDSLLANDLLRSQTRARHEEMRQAARRKKKPVRTLSPELSLDMTRLPSETELSELCLPNSSLTLASRKEKLLADIRHCGKHPSAGRARGRTARLRRRLSLGISR